MTAPSSHRLIALLLAGIVVAGTARAGDINRTVRDAVSVARELRSSESVYDQIAGAGALVDIGDKESLQFLADYMQHPDWVLQRSALDMLLNVQHPAGVDLVYRFAAMQEENAVFLKFLAESLASRPREDMSEYLMESLKTDDIWVKKYALQALASLPVDHKVERISAFAHDGSQDSVSRAYAFLALMGTDARDDILGDIIEISSSGGLDAKEAAAVGLGMVDTKQTRAALEKLTHASDHRVRIAAVASEAGFGDVDSINEIIYTIANGKGLQKSVAAATLRRLPPAVVVEISNTLLTCCELDADVAARLLESWAWVDADPAKLYDWGLASNNADVRMQTVWLVGIRQDRAYVDRIAPLLKDADSGVRGMAAWAIVRMLADQYEPGTET